MRTARNSGDIISINGSEYEIIRLLGQGGMSLIYEARQRVDDGGFAGRTVVKEFFPASNATRDSQGNVCCASSDPGEVERFLSLRRGMLDEGILGDDAREACSQVYAFDSAWNGYAVMRKFSKDTRSLAEVLDAWQLAPPSSEEEFSDMARVRYALRIAQSILTGLVAIHGEAGIIHRDISLGNIVWASGEFAGDGRDGRAYFLDFGSALRMGPEKRAANTSDPRQLTGTCSFSAPEIWELNSALTPATDLFSVSAILLVLCCGRKCCVRMMPGWHLATPSDLGRLYNSDYVVRASLNRLNVPAEIRGGLLDLLLEGLSRDPEKRFRRSAREMRNAVETLQIKCAPKQWMRDYAAFVSYRHDPLSIAVAQRLQKKIERYRIPKELAKRHPDGKLGAVFRDQDELAASADLSEKIREALDHSEFLIVVCTPNTPKSEWVTQEIAYFLRHHDRDHLLAVLASGSPKESFPPNLEHVYDADGNYAGDAEVLAANIVAGSARQTLRKLEREKLRLIAAMLGCPYDSLAQREKRYQMRRIALFLSALLGTALCFGAVLLRNNIIVRNMNGELERRNQLISQQKEQAQLSESQLLALDAREALESGDRTAALQAALAALPADAEDDRPYYAPAESALIEALGDGEDEVSYLLSKAVLKQETPIERYEISADGALLVTLDRYGTLHCFETATGALRWQTSVNLNPESTRTYSSDDAGPLLYSAPLNCVIGMYQSDFWAVSVDTGETLWRRDAPVHCSLCLTPDGNTLVSIEENELAFFTTTFHLECVAISVEDGQEHFRVELAEMEDSLDAYNAIPMASQCAFFGEGRYFASFYVHTISTAEGVDAAEASGDLPCERCYYIVDLNSGRASTIYTQTIESDQRYAKSYGLAYDAVNDAVIALWENEDSRVAATLQAIRADGGGLLWEHGLPEEEHYFSDLSDSRICLASGTSRLLFCREGYLYVINKASGDVKATILFPSEVVALYWVDNIFFGFVLADGTSDTAWVSSMGVSTSAMHDASYKLGSARSARAWNGGFLRACVEDDLVTGFISGSPEEGFGYVAVLSGEDNSQIQIVTTRQYDSDALKQSVGYIGTDDEIYLRPIEVLPGRRYAFQMPDGKFYFSVDDEDSSGSKLVRFNPETLECTEIAEIKADGGENYMLPDASGYVHTELNDSWISMSDDPSDFQEGFEREFDGTLSLKRFEPSEVIELAQGEAVIQRWTQQGQVRGAIIDRKSLVCCAYRASDGRLLTALCDGARLRLWLDGVEERELALPEGCGWQFPQAWWAGRMLETGGNGLVLLTRGDPEGSGEVRDFALLDTQSGEWSFVEDAARGSASRSAALGEASPAFAVVDADSVIRVYDAAEGALRWELPIPFPTSAIAELKFAMDDACLLLRTGDGQLLLFDLRSGENVYREQLPDDFYSIDACADAQGERLYLVCNGLMAVDNLGIVLDFRSWTKLAQIEGMLTYIPSMNRYLAYSYESGLYLQEIPRTQELVDSVRAVISP